MEFRVLYVVLWAKISHSPNYNQWKMANNPVSWWSLKIGATNKNFTWMKAHTLTNTRILNIHGTKLHCWCICVFGHWCGFQIFPVSVSVKWSVPNNASNKASQKSLISVWLNVAIPRISSDNLSGEEMHSIHWICPVYVRRSWDMYPCASLACYKWFHLQWWLHA
jgi:hypothetical protein